VSMFCIGIGAATPVSVVNFSMGLPQPSSGTMPHATCGKYTSMSHHLPHIR